MNQSEFDLLSPGSPRVLLTGTARWAAPARIAIGLARAGCAVSAVCPAPAHPLLKTSAVRQAFPYGALRPVESLAAAIEATDPDIIIPCDDRGVLHLHNLYSRECSQGRARGDITRLIERSLGAIPERLPNLGGRWLLADTPTDLSLGERVVLLEPDEVTVPRGPSEQDPVRPTDATK